MTGSKKSILYVEDDTDFHMYADALLHELANVTSVVSTMDARTLIAGSSFDLFLLDLVLKDGSGSGLARELKKLFPDTPIVILSAHNVTDVIEEADASFVKAGFDEDGFVNTIKQLLAV